MWNRLVARMVERSMPPDIEDPHEESIAAEAAENAIHQTARLLIIVGLIILLPIAALLYKYGPGQEAAQRPAEVPQASEGAKEPDADAAKLVQVPEELQKKLDDLTKERDDLSKERDALTKERNDLSTERDALRGKLADSQRQLADLGTRGRAAQELATVTKTARPAKQASPAPQARAPAGTPGSYRCGDGRTVRDPAQCRPAQGAAPEGDLDPQRSYQCGDGRAVPDPAQCRANPARPAR